MQAMETIENFLARENFDALNDHLVICGTVVAATPSVYSKASRASKLAFSMCPRWH